VSTLTTDQLGVISEALAELPATVSLWSAGRATVKVDQIVINRALLSASGTGPDPTDATVTPSDVASDINRYAPVGTYDAVAVAWKSWDETTNTYIPTRIFAMANGPSIRTGGAGFIALNEVHNTIGIRDVLVHELIHVVQQDLWDWGYPKMPTPDDQISGYTNDLAGSEKYLSDILTGQVTNAQGVALGGITRAMWAAGTPIARPVQCVWAW